MVKIGFISDTHTKHKQLQLYWESTGSWAFLRGCDAIVHCGDLTSIGYRHEIRAFLDWIKQSFNGIHVIFIAGNHDFYFDHAWTARTAYGKSRFSDIKFPTQAEIAELLAEYPNITYLDNSGIEVMGLKFWGSPITPWFHDWAFNRYSAEIETYWNMIPDDTDVLITHGPPYKILDLLHPKYQKWDEDVNRGCPILLDHIKNRIKPKIHAFGHIHEGYGLRDTVAEETGETIFINASSLNYNYEPVNNPVIVEI